MRRTGIYYLLIAAAIALPLVVGTARADEKDVETMSRYTPHGPHRFDLSYTRIDTFGGELDLFLFGYTGAFQPNMRIGITGGVATFKSSSGSDQRTDETGLSDTQVIFQYDPGDRLTASPWVPDTAGLNVSLIMPTGDADKGLSGDAWLGSIGVGWAIDFVSHFWLVPAVGYEFSFAEGSQAVPIETAYVDCAIIWLFPFGGWIGYAPTLARDIEADEWTNAHTLTIGKMWKSGFGLSLDLGKNDHTGRVPTRDDRTWLVNAYYQF